MMSCAANRVSLLGMMQMISAISAASYRNATAAWRNNNLLVRYGLKKTMQLAWATRFFFKLKIKGLKVPKLGLVSFAGRYY
jgi:hypothetical protein